MLDNSKILEVVVRQGITTSNGNVGGTTVIDSTLTEADNYWNNLAITILSGNSAGQIRRISGFTNITNTITVASAFNSQILSGTSYRIVAIVTTPDTSTDITALMADVGDASASALGSLYNILGNPTASLSAAVLNGINSRTNNTNLNAMLAIPDNPNDTMMRFVLDTIFSDNFDDQSLSTTLWGAPVTTGSTTVTESAATPGSLRILNTGAGVAGYGSLSTLLTFSRNLSIRAKIEVFDGESASDGERCECGIYLTKDINDYIFFGNYRDTSEAVNARGRITYNINGAGIVNVTVDNVALDNIAREYRIDVTSENIMFYINDILVYTLSDLTLLNYIVQLFAGDQLNTDKFDVRFDYCTINRISDDFFEIYTKLLQIQGGNYSIGDLLIDLENALDLNYYSSSITTDGTEQTLYSNTTANAFIFNNIDIDLVNMQAGDTIVIRKYKMVDGTNYRLVNSSTYTGVAVSPCVTVTGNEACRAGIKVTIQRTAGGDRAYPYTYFDEVA